MTLPANPSPEAADPADELLERSLRAWVAPPLPDDGFTAAVLRRVAASRGRGGLAPAEALQRLQVRRARETLQARCTIPGLGLGLAVAVACLLVGAPGTAAGGTGAWPWMLWLGAALAGTTGAVAWLVQQGD